MEIVLITGSAGLAGFQSHYPGWSFRYDLHMIIEELYGGLVGRV